MTINMQHFLELNHQKSWQKRAEELLAKINLHYLLVIAIF
jgi:hypothetical protein